MKSRELKHFRANSGEVGPRFGNTKPLFNKRMDLSSSTKDDSHIRDLRQKEENKIRKIIGNDVVLDGKQNPPRRGMACCSPTHANYKNNDNAGCDPGCSIF